MKGLKGLLTLVGFGALGYVALIGAIIAIRIGPTARALRAHSEEVRQEYQAISDRSVALYQTMDEIQMWLSTVARPTALKSGLDVLRRRVDSLTAPAAAPRLSQIPTAMRVEFTRSNVAQSRLGVLLLEVLANIEQGRMSEAQQQLALADSIARSADRSVAAAQRLGLDDLIAREESLAGAARASVRAIGIWAALGVVLAPFVVVFLRRRFYAPLADLTEGLQQVADGDLTWTVPVRRSDELGRVSEHFNQATAVLRQRAEEVRERAVTALRQSEKRYESMVEYAPIGVAVVDAAGRYVHTNAALQRFLGYSEEELRNKSYRDVTFPADVAASDRAFARLIAGDYDRYTLEKRYHRKDGAIVWARVAVAGVRDAAGALTHTISMIEDVTEEKRLQRQFETAFRMSPNPSVIARLEDGMIVEVNDAYCAISNFSRDEVIGKLARDLLWAEPDRREDFVRELREHGRIRDLEQKMKTKFGPQVDLLLSVEVIDLEGIPHVLTSGIDITSRKQAAEALRTSEEKFSKIFMASPNSIIITEEETGVLVDANEAFLAITGYTRAEAIGRSARDLVWRDPEQRGAILAKVRTAGRVRGEEVELRTKDGKIRYSLISVEVIELGGRRYLLSEGLDITDRKLASEALRESEERFRRLVQDLSIGVALLDPRGNVIHANPAAVEIFALTEAAVKDTAFWHQELSGLKEDGTSYPVAGEPVLNAIRGGTPLRDFLVGVPARGRPEPRWVLANVEPQRHADGTVRNVIVWFSDITEQRRADQQLRLLGHAVQSTSEMITITDRRGRFTFANRAFLERYGYTEQEVIGRTVDLVLSPLNPLGVQEEIRLGTERGGWSGELYNRTKDGTDFVIALTTAQVKDSKGNVIGLMGVSSDITERMAAAQALRESEERYRNLVEASPDGISVVQDDRIVFENPASLALIRGDAQDVIGRPALDFVTDEHQKRAGARLAAILAGEKDRVEELQLRTLDGRVITVETIGILITFQGRPAVLVIQRDVTDRKQAEQQLRLLAQAVKSTTEGISITDADGRLTFVNRAFAQAYGYTEAEIVGQYVSVIDSPRNRPGLQAEIRRATERGSWSGELWNRRKDGTDFVVSLTTAPVKDSEGRVIALMGVSTDVTERKQLQESVRRAETMAALGSVVAGVAHEVRNPLFGISATVDAFEARFGADPVQSRYSTTLRQEVNRLTKLMQDLLEYGKPPRLEIAVGDIATVVRRAIAACASLAESGGVWVREELPSNLPLIPMDQSRIQQVFQNLIENAIQHSQRDSTVTISASRSGEDDRGMLEITFTDRGPGFKPEDLPRLFEPFFTRRRGGTGLGLSIVQRILEQHDGDVLARNGADGGAIITVRLPLSRQRRRRSGPVLRV